MKTLGRALLMAALLLSCFGCGAVGKMAHPTMARDEVPAAQPAVVAASTGHPYYPLTDGTHFAYHITMITAAHWDAGTNELVIDARSPEPSQLGTTLIMRYATGKCASYPDKTFFLTEYSFGNTDQPPTGPIDRANMLGDIVATSSSGIRYIGEQVEGTYASQSAPEPLITMDPVAGEEIHETSTVSHGCDDPSVRESAFGLDYYTVRHLDQWNGFTDVWQTSLVERHLNQPPLYYSYFFVRATATQQGGMVGFSCWSDRVDYYSCGNEYEVRP